MQLDMPPSTFNCSFISRTYYNFIIVINDKPFSLDTGEAHVKKLREKGFVQENDIAVVVESQSDEFGGQ